MVLHRVVIRRRREAQLALEHLPLAPDRVLRLRISEVVEQLVLVRRGQVLHDLSFQVRHPRHEDLLVPVSATLEHDRGRVSLEIHV